MYIIVAGCGDAGYRLSRALRQEGHDVVIIDSSEKSCAHAQTLDVLTINGNAASSQRQAEARVDKADFFIATTGNDEVNMLSCVLAKSKNTRTIAIINNDEYLADPISDKFAAVGIDLAICPRLVTANNIRTIVEHPAILSDIELLSGGKIGVLEEIIPKNSGAAGKNIQELGLPRATNLVAIMRGGDVLIPHGSDVLAAGDDVIFLVDGDSTTRIIKEMIGTMPAISAAPTPSDAESLATPRMEPLPPAKKAKKVMIIGATRIGVRLAKLLEPIYNVTLIEESEERGQKAGAFLSKTLIIEGGAADKTVLIEEGIADTDVYVAATDVEETNVLSCLLAKRHGAKKTVAIVDKMELRGVLEYAGVDVPMSQVSTAVNTVLQCMHPEDVKSVKLIADGAAQIIEYLVPKKSPFAGKPLRKLSLPQGSLVGAISRGEDMIIPHGDDAAVAGDMLMIFAKTDSVPELEKMLR